MKFLISLLTIIYSTHLFSAVPTEEGLLKNVSNPPILGNLITIKAMVQNNEYYKLVLSLENPGVISLLQMTYSSDQMLASQLKDVKYVPDLVGVIRKEKAPERGIFYGILILLTTNRSVGFEAFLERSGIQIVRNKALINEEKMRLLRSYRTYLANNKGKGDANSPLNPSDPENRKKILELFKANTFMRSKNIELIKLENDFVWKVDWGTAKGYFSNEERRLRTFEYLTSDSSIKYEARDYALLNGVNEFPRSIILKDSKGQLVKMQIMGLETKTNNEKKLAVRYEEMKKSPVAVAGPETTNLFMF